MYICASVYLDWDIADNKNNWKYWKLTETNSNLKEKIKH